jgi:hypothetical protein
MRTEEKKSQWKPRGKYRVGKYRVRSWKMFEVLDEDISDDKDEFEVAEVIPCKNEPKKRRRGAFRTKQRQVNPEEPKNEVMETSAPRSPELDTVRIYFDCRSFVDLDGFIPFTANKNVRTCIRDSLGNIAYTKERFKNEMRCSWYGKMQVSQEMKKYGKNGKYGVPVLCFEYSVAKWYNMTSGVNSGVEPSARLVLIPCVQAMKAMNIELFSSVPFNRIVEEFVRRAEIRRFDLSINFQIPPGYSPDEYIDVLERCRLNRQDGKREGEGSISFGTAKSPYRVIFYNKEKEQKNFYLSNDADPHLMYIDDKGIEQHLDYNLLKQTFYKKNFDLFQNKLRFEVQFRTKFMQENNLETCGMENIDNVIRLGALYWRDVLDQFDEQLNRANFQYQEDEKTAISRILDQLETMETNEVISRTVCANKVKFITDCYRQGWKVVARKMGTNLFSQNRKWCNVNLNYDVKILPEELPIMYIMPTLYLSRTGKMLSNFVLNPAPVQVARAI